jgi:ubiquitin-conjugating enzyme E2 T
MSSTAISRMQKEVRDLQADPPPGVWAAPKTSNLLAIEAQLRGPEGTVYEGGVFRLDVDIPPRYPFEPPKVRFLTPVYHPNIDGEGRICINTLNPPPTGAWKPSLTVAAVLASLGLLLADPNPDDGLLAEVSEEFKHRREVFDAKARDMTKRHAMQEGRAGLETVKGAVAGPFRQADAAGGETNRWERTPKPPAAALEGMTQACGAPADNKAADKPVPGDLVGGGEQGKENSEALRLELEQHPAAKKSKLSLRRG